LDGARILIIGGGIGGLTSAIALRAKGFNVDVIERDPDWSVYGVGIIQQSNVVRAMAELGILDDYLDAAFAFDFVEIYAPLGERLARIPAPKLAVQYPANVGIARPALHKVLGDRTIAAGAPVRLGVTAVAIEDRGVDVHVRFTDGSEKDYDLLVGADGLHSSTRAQIFPEAPTPSFTGQGVWRYNLPRPRDLDCLRAYEGRVGVGLVPLSEMMMYLYAVTPEPGNPWYERDGLAEVMREKLSGIAPAITDLASQITDDAAVVYKPLEWLFLPGPWHKGRIVLLGDAIHATTPHLGQGAGMAIEDSIVLAEELARNDAPESAFSAYRERRFERCRYIVDASREIGEGQLGITPPVNYAGATRAMFEAVSTAI
jgi:2-polyprenyl-6-methoxyphenol hydroxylase-like FAD-dependent oxidoreductase